jgi:sn-glycerol 3-phosphate transport system substrate-binding protein
MKLYVRLLIIALVFAMTVVACVPPAAPTVNQETAASAADNSASSAEKMQIRFWYGLGGELGEVIEEMIKQYNASQDKIEVVGVFQQSYNGVQEKFQAALVSGDVPEIVQIEIHGTPKFASAGALTELQPFIDASADMNFEDLIPAGLLNQTWDGKIYAMPINRSTPVLYLNKAMFEAAGVEAPTTWQAFREVAKSFTSGEGDDKVYGFLATPSWWYFESMVWGNGGEIMNEDLTRVTFAEPGAAPLQIWADMIYQDGTARAFTGDQSFAQRNQAFAEGKGAMTFDSTAGLRGILRAVDGKFEIQTVFVPHMEGFNTAVPTGGAAAGIPAAVSAEKKQAAWEFIKWWISTEQNAFWSQETGYWPVRYSSVEKLRAEKYYEKNPAFETTIKQLEFAKAAPSTPYWPVISKEIGTAIEDVLVNNTPAIDALKKAEAAAQAEIE